MAKTVWSKSSFTVESPGAEKEPNATKPLRASFLAKTDLVDMPPGVNTLHDNFLTGMKITGDGPYLGHRALVNGKAGPYVWQSYNEVYKRVKNLGSGLHHRNIQRQENVGLFSINRAEWVIAEQACYMFSYTTVPLYDTLGNEAIEFILTQTEMRVVVATYDKALILVKLKDRLPHLDTVVVMDEFPASFMADGKAVGVEIIGISMLEQQGAQAPASSVLPTSEDVATICYTSGTTGVPKGVVLTHRNILSAAYSVTFGGKMKRFATLTKDDVHISYLPLAHVFERIIQQFAVFHGASIGFYQGDTMKLLDDVQELRPTCFISVPRLFNRIYDRVLAGVKAKGGVAAFLFNTAYAQKKAGLARGTVTHFLWDKLVFANVRAKLGGRVRFLLTGSAPISRDVMDFLKICFSVDVFEGYGQTETAAGISVTFAGDYSSGHIGVPLGCGEIKLVDVPSMNYTSLDKPRPRGEICVRGNQVFKCYYKEPEKTREAFYPDGWLRTGDVGAIDEFGRLVIIDRVKQIFKLAQGEYIAPEKIENVYCKHEIVAQAFVYGDSLQASLVGIIVPDPETFSRWASSNGFSGSHTELCAKELVKKKVLQTLVAHGKGNDLKGFENIRAIHLEHEMFSVENNLLTPTFKLKRHDAQKKYQANIDAMYASINA